MIKKIVFLLILSLGFFSTYADNVRFVMSAPNVVSSGEQFRLSFTLYNASGSELKLPDLSNFEILMGPSTSQSSSFQSVNGQVTQSMSVSYLYVLRAKTEGNFAIRPASIKADGKTYESNSLSIQVVKGEKPSQQQQRSQGGGGGNDEEDSAPSGSISKNELFVKVSVDKSSVYKGEQLVATVKLYVSPNVPVSGFQDVKIPSYEGFWTQDIDVPNQVNFTREAYNNKIYQVGLLKKTILSPQQVGSIRIDPFEITCLVQQRVRRQQSFFDDFFDNYRTVQAKISSEPVTIRVKDLPGSPDGFCGGVGNFNISGSLDKTQAKSNEAVTLKLTVSGTGSIKLIDAPKVELPADFEKYDPKSTEKISAGEGGVSGSKTFEYLFIPRYAGDFTIPEIPFTYFNPATQQFVSNKVGPFSIHVEKGKDDQTSAVVSSASKEDVKFIGKDIRFIKQNKPKLESVGQTFFGSASFYFLYLLGIALFGVVYFLYRKKLHEDANVSMVLNKRANKMALKLLKEASGFMTHNKAEQFYEAVLKAFWGYLSNKLGIPVADLNRENASAAMVSKGVDQALIDEFIGIINDCEFARYAPAAFSGTLQEVYERAATTLGKLEKQIK